ncbi:hypothetical protein MUP29_08525 [bacterium]|nr:hypothetical protein [bacterium]
MSEIPIDLIHDHLESRIETLNLVSWLQDPELTIRLGFGLPMSLREHYPETTYPD